VAVLAYLAWVTLHFFHQAQGVLWFVTNFCWISVHKPGMQFVAHLTYFGPVVLLAGLRWQQVVAGVCAQGPGLAFALLYACLFLPNPESRHMTLFLPLVAAFTVRAWQHDASWLLTPFALTALLASKVWLVINPFPTPRHFGELLEFPGQAFFLS